jgi:RHS repeat-associated protein
MYRGGNTLGARDLGNKHYELGNHLGNVLAVVTDNIHMADDLTTTAVASASDYYPFGLQMDSRTVNEGDYRYGFNGKEKDQDGEFGNTHYDYGFRIYNPAIAKFLSVDPLTRHYPWNSPYSYAENDVIRSIDLDGLEKVVIIESPFNAKRIKDLLQVKKYSKIYKIVEYSSNHGWVDNDGQPSSWLVRQQEKMHGDNIELKLTNLVSAFVFDIPDDFVDKDLVKKYGDIDDHGGYMQIDFYNWETQELEHLGEIPLSKINEHEEFTVYSHSDELWNMDTDLASTKDKLRELGSRPLKQFGADIFQGKGVLGRSSKVPKGTARGPLVIDFQQLMLDKVRYRLKNILRALGPNSGYEVAVQNDLGITDFYMMTYQIDEQGNETFKEYVNMR